MAAATAAPEQGRPAPAWGPRACAGDADDGMGDEGLLRLPVTSDQPAVPQPVPSIRRSVHALLEHGHAPRPSGTRRRAAAGSVKATRRPALLPRCSLRSRSSRRRGLVLTPAGAGAQPPPDADVEIPAAPKPPAARTRRLHRAAAFCTRARPACARRRLRARPPLPRRPPARRRRGAPRRDARGGGEAPGARIEALEGESSRCAARRAGSERPPPATVAGARPGWGRELTPRVAPA